jgi:hypothetical protein
MKIIPIMRMSKKDAASICGSLTVNSKMPCKTYNLPTEACKTGFKMSQIKGSVCSMCYADKGFNKVYENSIKPGQFARLDSITNEHWVDSIVTLIGNDKFFRWHSSGDIQSLEHFKKIVDVALKTPNCGHWLPTREYSIIKEYIAQGLTIPKNLIVRISAMYPDQPVILPKSLIGVKGISLSNVHTVKPIGIECNAPKNNGSCGDCRLCWSTETVSYKLH